MRPLYWVLLPAVTNMAAKKITLAAMRKLVAPPKTRAALMKRLVVPDQFKTHQTYTPPARGSVPYKGPQPGGGPYRPAIPKLPPLHKRLSPCDVGLTPQGAPMSTVKTLTGKGARVPLTKQVANLPSIFPCPFCKSTNVRLEQGVTYPYAMCDDCNAHGPYIHYSIRTTKKPELLTVAKLWNAAKR